jgi:hypothetical protein
LTCSKKSGVWPVLPSPTAASDLGRAMEDLMFLSLGRMTKKSMSGHVLLHLKLKLLFVLPPSHPEVHG